MTDQAVSSADRLLDRVLAVEEAAPQLDRARAEAAVLSENGLQPVAGFTFEAGLGSLWIFNEFGVLMPEPAMWSADGFLHRGDGPAVIYESGLSFWFWRGINVTQQVIEAPETLRPKEILAERNVEVRRIMMERFGFDRLLRESKAKKRSKDEYGVLWELPVPDDEPLVMVEVVNSTAEPDGTFKDYWLRVPPTARTPREAIAWTFGVDDYAPAVET